MYKYSNIECERRRRERNFQRHSKNVFLHYVDSYRIHIRISGRTVRRIRQGFTLTEIRCRTRVTNSKKLFARPKSKSPGISNVMPQSRHGLIRIYLSSDVSTTAADDIQLLTVSYRNVSAEGASEKCKEYFAKSFYRA